MFVRHVSQRRGLGEGAAIVALLFEAFFADETLVDVFDAVLINEGFEELINSFITSDKSCDSNVVTRDRIL